MSESLHRQRVIAIVGAGAKGIAIAVKARALSDVGYDVPRVVLIERNQIASTWSSNSAWTNGTQRLGSSPLKDLGFPYGNSSSGLADPAVEAMVAEYSWPSFLREKRVYARWVDGGMPHPRHREWGDYLRWAGAKAGAEVIRGEVTGLSRKDNALWNIQFARFDGAADAIESNAVVFTGASVKRTFSLQSNLVLDIDQYWKAFSGSDTLAGRHVAIVGGGETAASVMSSLLESGVRQVTIVAPRMLRERAESFLENVHYSEPEYWRTMSLIEREDFVRATDRGAFSPSAARIFASDDRVDAIVGRVVRARTEGSKLVLQVQTSSGWDTAKSFDIAIDATGADYSYFLALLDDDVTARISRALGMAPSATTIEQRLESDMSIPGISPHIYAPCLGAIGAGPGYPNMTTLGAMADEILSAWVSREELPAARTATAAGIL